MTIPPALEYSLDVDLEWMGDRRPASESKETLLHFD